MNDGTTPPGWYNDPTTPGLNRWWDGSNWSAATQPAVAAAPVDDFQAGYAAPGGGFGSPGYGAPGGPSGGAGTPGGFDQPQTGYGAWNPQAGFGTQPGPGQPNPWQAPPIPPAGYQAQQPRVVRQQSFFQANQLSFTSIGVALAYLVLAQTTHVVMLGVIPVMMGVRAMGRKEPLGVVAMLLAVGVAVAGVMALAG